MKSLHMEEGLTASASDPQSGTADYCQACRASFSLSHTRKKKNLVSLYFFIDNIWLYSNNSVCLCNIFIYLFVYSLSNLLALLIFTFIYIVAGCFNKTIEILQLPSFLVRIN